MTSDDQSGTPASAAAGRPIRVVLVDDHAMFRSGVRGELAGSPTVSVVGEAGDVDGAVDAVTEQRPDVVLLDVHLPGGGGATVMKRATVPDTRYLALSVSDAAEDVAEGVEEQLPARDRPPQPTLVVLVAGRGDAGLGHGDSLPEGYRGPVNRIGLLGCCQRPCG